MSSDIPLLFRQALMQCISPHHPIDKEEAGVIASFFKPQKFKRKASLLSAGETARWLYFVVEGVLHMYYADDRGQAHSCHFFMPGEIATDLESFSKQTAADNYIEALTAVSCLAISCKDTVALMERSDVFNRYVTRIVETVAMQNIARTKDLLSLQPEARYQKLLITRPDLLRAVPLKYIARFLGMSPENLSRIRNRLTSGASD